MRILRSNLHLQLAVLLQLGIQRKVSMTEGNKISLIYL